MMSKQPTLLASGGMTVSVLTRDLGSKYMWKLVDKKDFGRRQNLVLDVSNKKG